MIMRYRAAAYAVLLTCISSAAFGQAEEAISAVRHISVPAARGWRPWAKLPFAMGLPMVVESEGRVFFMGGIFNGDIVSDKVFSFDLRSRTWRARAPLPEIITEGAAAALDGKIYVAGGCARADMKSPVAAARVFDPATDAWTTLAPMPERVCGGLGAAIGGRFYVFGGLTSGGKGELITAHVHIFDPRSGAWSRGGDMPRARVHAAGAPLAGRFLLIGGCRMSGGEFCEEVMTAVDAYDASDGSWSSAPSLPRPLHAHGAAAVGGAVIVAGGRASKHIGPTMESARTLRLAAGASEWSAGPSLPAPTYKPQLFPVADGVALFGGPTNNPDDLIYTLGVPGPFIDPGETRRPDYSPFTPPSFPGPAAPPQVSDAEELPPPSRLDPHAHAVVIGVERYREALPRADFAAGDARLTAEYFKRVLGVPEENLALLTDDRATKSDFEKYFERWLPNQVEPGDKVYVYFSGHGAPNPKSGESYLVPYDADPTYIEETGYSIKRLYGQLSKLPARSVLVALDSCFSGAGGHSVIAKGARPLVLVRKNSVPRPLTVITASSGEQISNSYQKKGRGLFTFFFLQALKENGSDFHAVYKELKPQVSRVARREFNSDQTPEWSGGD